LAGLALILGMVATICPFLYSMSANFIVFAIPLGLVALLVALFARRAAVKRSAPTGLATVGVIFGVLPLVIATGMLVMYSRFTSSGSEFSAKDPAQAAEQQQQHIKNSKEFDDLFKKALQQDKKEETKK
jgi:hypothetical protein